MSRISVLLVTALAVVACDENSGGASDAKLVDASAKKAEPAPKLAEGEAGKEAPAEPDEVG